jgi:hypothetical protein
MRAELLRVLTNYVKKGYTWQQAMEAALLELRDIAFSNDGIMFNLAVDNSGRAFDNVINGGTLPDMRVPH